MIRRPSARADGQIIVIFAVALVAIALMVGLVVDGGMAFLQRRDGQNDADLAALAGTKIVADGYMGRPTGLTVSEAIADSLRGNGCEPTSATPCAWTARYVGAGGADLGPVSGAGAIAGPSIMGVRVDVRRQPRTFFLGLVGQGAWRVDTSATAMTAHPSAAPAGQLLPIALYARTRDFPFTQGQIYDLTPDRIAPGGFAWVHWPDRSVASSTCTPDNPVLTLGKSGTIIPRAPRDSDWLAIRQCLRAWQTSGATVLIPLYDGDPGAPRYRMAGVAAFVIRSVGDPKDNDQADFDIQASFVGTFAFAAVPADVDQPPQSTDSMYYLGLVK